MQEAEVCHIPHVQEAEVCHTRHVEEAEVYRKPLVYGVGEEGVADDVHYFEINNYINIETIQENISTTFSFIFPKHFLTSSLT